MLLTDAAIQASPNGLAGQSRVVEEIDGLPVASGDWQRAVSLASSVEAAFVCRLPSRACRGPVTKTRTTERGGLGLLYDRSHGRGIIECAIAGPLAGSGAAERGEWVGMVRPTLCCVLTFCLPQSLNVRSNAVRRTEPLPRYIQAIVRQESSTSPETLAKRLDNLEHLVTHTRVHGELLARYNPVYGKSEAERIRATANRVGWDIPIEYQDQAKKLADGDRQGIDEKYRS